MFRTSWVALTAMLLVLAGSARSADAPPAGKWKFSFFNRGVMTTIWLIKLEQKDGKWTGTVDATIEGFPPGAALSKVNVEGGKLTLVLGIQKQELGFEGNMPKEAGKKILGSVSLPGQVTPAELEPTTLTSIDSFELSKETVAKGSGPELFAAVVELLEKADAKKATADEVRSWTNKAFAAAEPYGPRWQREMAMRMASQLLTSETFVPVAVEYARKAQRLLEPNDDYIAQMRVLNVLASALTKSKKEKEALEIEKLADEMYLKNMPPFQPGKFAGRKKKGDRVVLAELFTGAQCVPCVAADLAFDGLLKTYAPTDVVLLQYHMHVPGPDPLANEDSMARARYYEDEIEGPPTMLFNGKLKPRIGGGGPATISKEKYEAYRGALEPLLETEPESKLTLKATRKGDKIDLVAEAAGAKGTKLQLRLALVEPAIRYTGGNNIRFHHHVVRAMPGTVQGLPLKDGAAKQELTVDLGNLRDSINKYLNDVAKRAPFPNQNRPLDFKNLYVVAFVQSDDTKDVLQAVQVKIESDK